jgi:dienelactone hydrolase
MDAAMSRALACGLLCAGGLLPLAAAAQPLRDASVPNVELTWLPAPASGPRPTVVALHGCGGLTNARGALDARYVEYAARWNAAGWNVLLPDSFSARGKKSICSERNAERGITVAQRREDVNAALGWLAARPEVDTRRVALLGWSNGGSTVLRTIDRPAWPLAPVTAIALYPGCAAALRRADYAPAVPLLLLIGAVDDWTPPQPCIELAERLRARPGGPAVDLVVYADSYHGFDGSGRLRQRTDVPNGVDPTGVHVGGNPAARADALPRIDATLRRAFERPTP